MMQRLLFMTLLLVQFEAFVSFRKGLVFEDRFSCFFRTVSKQRNGRIDEIDKIPQQKSQQSFNRARQMFTRSILPAALSVASYLKQSLSPVEAMGDLPEYNAPPLLLKDICLNVLDIDLEVSLLEQLFQGRCKEIRRYRRPGATRNEEEVFSVVGFGPDGYKLPENFYPGVTSPNYYGGHGTITLRCKRTVANTDLGNAINTNEEEVIEVYNRGDGLQCIKIGASTIRLSKAIEKGGKVKYAYGWIDLDSPNQLPYHIIIGERIDPLVALYLRVRNVNETSQWLEETLGMKELTFPLARSPGSMYEPVQPQSSRYYGYTNHTMGILIMENYFDSFSSESGNTLLEREVKTLKSNTNFLSTLFSSSRTSITSQDIPPKNVTVGSIIDGLTILVDDSTTTASTTIQNRKLPEVIQKYLEKTKNHPEQMEILYSPDGYPFRLQRYSDFQMKATNSIPYDLTEISFPSPSLPITDFRNNNNDNNMNSNEEQPSLSERE